MFPIFGSYGFSNSPFTAGAILRGQEMMLARQNFPYGYITNIGGNTITGVFEGNMPYHEAYAKNIMMNNPYYFPYIPIESAGGIQTQIDTSKAELAANRDALLILNQCLGNNIDNKLKQIDQALQADGLGENKKATLEAEKAKLEDLKNRLEDFRKKSPDMEVTDAIKTVKGFEKEYKNIVEQYEKDQAAVDNVLDDPNVSEEKKQAIKDKQAEIEKAKAEGKSPEEIQKLEDELKDLMNNANNANDNDNTPMEHVGQNKPAEEMSVDEIKKAVEEETQPAIDKIAENPAVSDEAKQAIQAKQEELKKAIEEGKPQEEIQKLYKELNDLVNNAIDNINKASDSNNNVQPTHVGEDTNVEQMSVDDVKKALKDEVKPEIDKLIASPNLDAETKKAIQEKQKELEKAIEEGKPQEEVQGLYQELIDLVNGAKDKAALEEQKIAEKEAQDLAQVKNDIDTEVKNFEASELSPGHDLALYLSPKDKKLLKDKMDAIKAAKDAGKTSAELRKMLNDMKANIEKIKKETQQIQKESVEIATKIYEAAKGIDISWFGINTTKNEKIIKEYAAKINEKNVLGVLTAWEMGGYRSGSGDNCLFETIAGEFTRQSTINSIIDPILSAFEKYAKNNGLTNKIAAKFGKIKADIHKDAEDGYVGLRDLLKDVFNIPDYTEKK